MPLNQSVKIVLTNCISLTPDESFLIITDENLFNLANEFFKESLRITKKSKIIKTIIPEFNGAEPSQNVSDKLLNCDAALLITAKSLSHTNARKNASLNGARIASMPGLTFEMAERALNVDYGAIIENNNKLFSLLKNKKYIRIKTKKGTDIGFNFENRNWIMDIGIYTKKGSFGNLPAGEIFSAPVEGKTNGVFVVDASIAGIGILKSEVRIYVKNGLVDKVAGNTEAKKLESMFKGKNYKNIAELGIGTNPKAIITGNVLEDEKALGTCHIAFGNNKHFGGLIDVPFHIDCVIKNPEVYGDDRRLF